VSKRSKKKNGRATTARGGVAPHPPALRRAASGPLSRPALPSAARRAALGCVCAGGNGGGGERQGGAGAGAPPQRGGRHPPPVPAVGARHAAHAEQAARGRACGVRRSANEGAARGGGGARGAAALCARDAAGREGGRFFFLARGGRRARPRSRARVRQGEASVLGERGEARPRNAAPPPASLARSLSRRPAAHTLTSGLTQRHLAADMVRWFGGRGGVRKKGRGRE